MRSFRAIVNDAGYEPRAYSGRGMRGVECFGVSCDDPESFGLDLVEEAQNAEEVAYVTKCLRGKRTDNLGKRFIVYFPNIFAPDADNGP